MTRIFAFFAPVCTQSFAPGAYEVAWPLAQMKRLAPGARFSLLCPGVTLERFSSMSESEPQPSSPQPSGSHLSSAQPLPAQPSPSFYHLVEQGRRAQRYLILLAIGVLILSALALVQWRAIARFAKASQADYAQEVRGFAEKVPKDNLLHKNAKATNTPAPLASPSLSARHEFPGSQAREGEAAASQSAAPEQSSVSFFRYRLNPNNFVVEALPAKEGEKEKTGGQFSSQDQAQGQAQDQAQGKALDQAQSQAAQDHGKDQGQEQSQAATPKLFLITIDDAPDEHMLDLAKACSDAGVKAIFFVNGFFLQDKAQVAAVKKVLAMGHSIGNHSHSHSKLTLLSYEEQKKEIVDFNQALEATLGVRPRFFRPPFGEYSADTLQLCAEAGLTLLNWTYGYDDLSAYKTPEALTKVTLESPRLIPGATLVFHDQPCTAKALPDILRGLLDMGYQPVDPALIASDGPAPMPEE